MLKNFLIVTGVTSLYAIASTAGFICSGIHGAILFPTICCLLILYIVFGPASTVSECFSGGPDFLANDWRPVSPLGDGSTVRLGFGNCFSIPENSPDHDHEVTFQQHAYEDNVFNMDDFRNRDSGLVNPATGLMMTGGIGGFDSAGNTFGTDLNSHW